MEEKALYVCEFCGYSTYTVSEEYLVGTNHLVCLLENTSESSTTLK